MKALRTLLTAIVLLTGAMTMNAQRMSILAMQSNARFLTDRMAYTLGIRDPFLIDEIYRINYDYIWGVNDYLDDVALGYYYDDYLAVCAARDAALRNLLGYTIWNRLIGYTYFHRPIVFVNRGWHFSIYDYDRYGINRYYYHAPRPIACGYAGGHFFRPMAPRGSRHGAPAPVAVHRRETHSPAPHREMHYNRQNGLRMENHREARPDNHADNHRQNINGNSNMNSGSTPNMNRPNQPERTNSNMGNHTERTNSHVGNHTERTNSNMGTSMNRTNSNMERSNHSMDRTNSYMRSSGNANSSSRQYTPRSTSTPSLTNASMTTRSSAGHSMNRSNARMSSPSHMGGGSIRGGSQHGGARHGGRR